MRDDMRDRDAGDVAARGSSQVVQPAPSDPERQLPAEAGQALGSDDPEVARADIEATRARMSQTIDVIEETLVRKKERIQDRLDVVAPVREHPWRSMGIALGSGLLLGLLTGGGDDDEERVETRSRRGIRESEPDWERRARILERRSRRLLSIARDQQRELEELREGETGSRLRHPVRTLRHAAHEVEEDLEHGAERVRHGYEQLRDSLVSQITRFVMNTVRHQFAGRR
jgi:ElaB/YqjD/DUF883 family membrane-anchored ribosome-binding protein